MKSNEQFREAFEDHTLCEIESHLSNAVEIAICNGIDQDELVGLLRITAGRVIITNKKGIGDGVVLGESGRGGKITNGVLIEY